MKKILWAMTALLGVAACTTIDDDIPAPPRKPLTEAQMDSLYADSIMKLSTSTVLQPHSSGDGFHIIIMGDGFTSSDISNGKYRAAVQKAKDAIFEQEPMKSLQGYVDVIEVAVPSTHDGVDYTKRRTGLRTSLSSGNDSNVYGDSIAILNCACKALINAYQINSNAELTRRIYKSLIITLLNTNIYKGVTLLAADESITDGTPNGYSLSYVPAYATVNNIDVMPYLIRHEGVGHGIAKLADEYYYASKGTPQSSVITQYQESKNYGFYQNTTYRNNATATNQTFSIEYSSWLYPFSQRSEYANSDVQWYAGAFEYATGFCRFGDFSIMNATLRADNPSYDPKTGTFNVASRAMIYRRIMKAANSSWQWSVNDFIYFDSPARASYATSNARGVKATPSTVITNAPALAAPKLIKMDLPKAGL